MTEANVPENEVERLEHLYQLKMLFSSPEEEFDRITRLACRTLGVKIAAISLIDKERQWFKSITGFDITETSRKVAFCAHAILQDKPLVVLDASRDSRFFDNPLVLENPKIRFYAGVPLALSSNIKIGTLCVIDTKPMYFSDQQLKDLVDLAKITEDLLRTKLKR